MKLWENWCLISKWVLFTLCPVFKEPVENSKYLQVLQKSIVLIVTYLILTARDDWSLFGWILDHIQACQTRKARYWCHSLVAIYSIEVKCAFAELANKQHLKIATLFHLITYEHFDAAIRNRIFEPISN